MPRRLRIAASVFFGLLTVALCVLWVRSYWRYDFISRHSGPETKMLDVQITCISNHGHLTIYRSQAQYASAYFAKLMQPPTSYWTTGSTAADGKAPEHFVEITHNYVGANVPYPLLIAATLVSSVLPAIGVRRFSLRTLLLATTLCAVVLGLIAWAAKS